MERGGLQELFEVNELLDASEEDSQLTETAQTSATQVDDAFSGADPGEATELRFDTEWSQESTESRPSFSPPQKHRARDPSRRLEVSGPARPGVRPAFADAPRPRRRWMLPLFLLAPSGAILGFFGVTLFDREPARPPATHATPQSQWAPAKVEVRVERAVKEEAPRIEAAPLPDTPEPSAAALHGKARRSRVDRVANRAESPPPRLSERAEVEPSLVRWRRLLRDRGLTESDASLLVPEPLARWRKARQGVDRSEELDAFEDLTEALSRAAIDREFLGLKLTKVLSQLRARREGGELPAERARTLERRYFELRRRLLSPGVAPDAAKAQELHRAVEALRLDIEQGR